MQHIIIREKFGSSTVNCISVFLVMCKSTIYIKHLDFIDCLIRNNAKSVCRVQKYVEPYAVCDTPKLVRPQEVANGRKSTHAVYLASFDLV